MKVDVITVEQVTIKKWCFWSNWIDIAVVQYDYVPYLIQMRVCVNNEKEFKAVPMVSGACKWAAVSEIGDLTQMSKDKAGGK